MKMWSSSNSQAIEEVTIFSSIPGIVESLIEVQPNLPMVVIVDSNALGGYGGTVDFDPKLLQEETKLKLREAIILISEPFVVAKLLEYDNSALRNLKWCQSTYAGVDPLFNALNKHKFTTPTWKLTRFAGCFGPPIAEWCLARIIATERNFDSSYKDQQSKEWAKSKNEILNYRYLSNLTLVILGGCGDIGSCIARSAKLAFGMKIVSYGKTPRLVDTGEFIDEYTTDLTEALQSGDYIISVLPSTPETRGLLNNNTLKQCSLDEGGKCPVFINVGRGDVVSEESIIDALNSRHISKAILDVFEIEPLPKSSKLWDHPNVVISPHISGLTQSQDVPKVFLSNYKLYVAKQDLKYEVDWNKGY